MFRGTKYDDIGPNHTKQNNNKNNNKTTKNQHTLPWPIPKWGLTIFSTTRTPHHGHNCLNVLKVGWFSKKFLSGPKSNQNSRTSTDQTVQKILRFGNFPHPPDMSGGVENSQTSIFLHRLVCGNPRLKKFLVRSIKNRKPCVLVFGCFWMFLFVFLFVFVWFGLISSYLVPLNTENITWI